MTRAGEARRQDPEGSDAVSAEALTGTTIAPLPELRPSRQAGWIFRDDECVVVERRYDDTGRLAAVTGD